LLGTEKQGKKKKKKKRNEVYWAHLEGKKLNENRPHLEESARLHGKVQGKRKKRFLEKKPKKKASAWEKKKRARTSTRESKKTNNRLFQKKGSSVGSPTNKEEKKTAGLPF